jgi:hypothetical protein
MNYASFVLQEERVLADQTVHHVPSQNLLAVHPDDSLAAYRAVLKFNVEEFSAHRNHPPSHQVALAVILLQRLAVIRNSHLHA